MKEVLRTHSLSFAHSARLALENDGISAVLQNEHALGFIGLAGEIRVSIIQDADFDRARAVLQRPEFAPKTVSLPPWWRLIRFGVAGLGLGFLSFWGGAATADGDWAPVITRSLLGIGGILIFGGLTLIFLGALRDNSGGAA